MLKHSDIWQAIDQLAQRHGLSASGLAKRGGLDPTTFNKSKRTTPDGKLRWPSTESIAKVLEATGSSFTDFVGMADGVSTAGAPPAAVLRRIPVIGYAQAGNQGYFDDAGYPVGNGWDELEFPHVADERAYALEISGDSMEPVYRDGDIIIVSPAETLRRGDRVVVRTREGEVMAKQLLRQTANRIDLVSLNKAHPDRSLAMGEVAWIARILWASQ
ncbi:MULTISPECIES: helix-turn-helix transcriptional regulator [Azospirillaceae]|uniref:S24 family peptidase n=1 Tax=Azospirillaceae TaxID=2829815 RepID=UPI000B74A25D|nr:MULTISPECIES: helix-turn-helix transcriptional regulator [Azospirillaceae]MDG5495932.1 helix-turn-helix transcriptional regulator [Niveispirillum sp. BGYR6]SNT06197.1 Phage repressor protein C, contains Cro/C1-type HTH and peptisase s24 domains [Azospirillum sp. RU38E]SNT21274.1 Phage repressor protein C, contains Cro/C1-type HTH and peptisase s24 domains [Azospirillum sp. RU37A]